MNSIINQFVFVIAITMVFLKIFVWAGEPVTPAPAAPTLCFATDKLSSDQLQKIADKVNKSELSTLVTSYMSASDNATKKTLMCNITTSLDTIYPTDDTRKDFVKIAKDVSSTTPPALTDSDFNCPSS